MNNIDGASLTLAMAALGKAGGGSNTYQPFPNGESLSGTLEQVVEKIFDTFPSTEQGMAYLGSIEGSCTPFGYGNVECTVTFMTDYLAVLSVSSSDTYPYHWEYNTASGDFKWREFVIMPEKPSDFSSKTYTLKFVNGEPTWVQG